MPVAPPIAAPSAAPGPPPAAAPIAVPEAAPNIPPQGRVGRDHMGLCRPRGSTLTRQSHRAQLAHCRSPLRPSTGSNRQRQRYIAPFLSTNPGQVSKTLWPSLRVRDLTERVEPHPRPTWGSAMTHDPHVHMIVPGG